MLEVLAEMGPLHGLGIVAASRGRVKRGGVYVLLQRLERRGGVVSERRPTGAGLGSPRRLFSIAPRGRLFLEAQQALARVLGG